MSVQRRNFPDSFKREAVDRVANGGLSVGAVARELGLHEDELVHLYPKQAKVFLDGSALGHEAKLTSPARAVAS